MACGVEEEDVREMLSNMGFGVNRTAAAIEAAASTLSGGWRMKLALSRAMLLNPDMLLLDEPTNHLDQFAVKWLTDYIINLKTCTCLLVSHDTGFLDAVCTNIIHYENLKLKSYLGNLSEFVKQKPEAKAYYELSSDIIAFGFPEPGPMDGVKSLTKSVLRTKNIFFQYPTHRSPTSMNQPTAAITRRKATDMKASPPCIIQTPTHLTTTSMTTGTRSPSPRFPSTSTPWIRTSKSRPTAANTGMKATDTRPTILTRCPPDTGRLTGRTSTLRSRRTGTSGRPTPTDLAAARATGLPPDTASTPRSRPTGTSGPLAPRKSLRRRSLSNRSSSDCKISLKP